MLKKARLLTHPTLAATSPARPESAKTASSPRDAPCPKQGHSSATDPRFTFHGSRERCENDAGGLFQHPVTVVRWAHRAGHAHRNKSGPDGTICSREAVRANGPATPILELERIAE